MERKWGRPSDPTPFEIAIATAKIRTTWSEAEHRVRAGVETDNAWEPPCGRLHRIERFLDAIEA